MNERDDSPVSSRHEEEFAGELPDLPALGCAEGDTYVQVVGREHQRCGFDDWYQRAFVVPREEHFECACNEWHLVWSQLLWNPEGTQGELTGELCYCPDEEEQAAGTGYTDEEATAECGLIVVGPAVVELPADCS
ncbi:MAG: hypothetical protein K0V04_41660 [Deltaproteobacteria bacterium]|nr:hypothetical protein [Deltaproteobacteria bacterium]